MATKKTKKAKPKKINLPEDKPVKLNMSFEEAIKLAATTPIKNSKSIKK
jgi:hypothetical protein